MYLNHRTLSDIVIQTHFERFDGSAAARIYIINYALKQIPDSGGKFVHGPALTGLVFGILDAAVPEGGRDLKLL